MSFRQRLQMGCFAGFAGAGRYRRLPIWVLWRGCVVHFGMCLSMSSLRFCGASATDGPLGPASQVIRFRALSVGPRPCEVNRVELRRMWRRASLGWPFSGGAEAAFLCSGLPSPERDALAMIAHDVVHWAAMVLKHSAAGRASAASEFRASVRAMCCRARGALRSLRSLAG